MKFRPSNVQSGSQIAASTFALRGDGQMSDEQGGVAKDDALSETIDRNITALLSHEAEQHRRATLQDRIADRITAFAGSMPFVYVHLVVFGAWIVLNLVPPPWLRPWDPTLVILAMVASVEAIFIATFVLISQNRMAEIAERRANLNLQISLLAEHETTRLMALVSAIARRLDVKTNVDSEVRELQRDIGPEDVLSRIEQEEREHGLD
jgi:uncharacterized membrane protein